MQQYPLHLKFTWSFARQIILTDDSDQLLLCIRQKMFKLKEVIGVFGDKERSQLKYEINADRIIDFSARYNFTDSNGRDLGAVKRRGWRSIWRARYDIFNGDEIVFTITEKNPWVKIADTLFAEIPIVGLFTGFVFNPTYQVHRSSDEGNIVMLLEKKPSFFSRMFTIKLLDKSALEEYDEERVLLSMIMMLLLEKARG
ncbi:MAG: hypothetical protein ACFCBU_10020 [Cyanophyceae cyanobacterium]